MSKTMLLLALSIILLNSKSGNHRHHSCEVFREYRVLTTIETFGIASDKCLGHFARKLTHINHDTHLLPWQRPRLNYILVKSSVTVSQNISVTVTTDTADTDEAVENRVKAILTELLAVRRSRKLNELTLSDINHAIRSGYSGATNAAVSEPEADVKLGKDKVITLGDVSVTVERE